MPSDKADPTTESLPAEQANPAGPVPAAASDTSSAQAMNEDGSPVEMSKKGGEFGAVFWPTTILWSRDVADVQPRKRQNV